MDVEVVKVTRGVSCLRIAGLALRVLWCAAALGVLVVMLWHWNPGDPEERDNPIVFFYLMMILTFPAGALATVLGALVLLGLEHFIRIPNSPSRFSDYIVPWLLITTAGYWQWFKLVPWLGRRIRFGLIPWLRSKVRSKSRVEGP